jgi:hypothetical protein
MTVAIFGIAIGDVARSAFLSREAIEGLCEEALNRRAAGKLATSRAAGKLATSRAAGKPAAS